MNNIIKSVQIASLVLGFLTSCVQPYPHPMDMTAAVHSAKTKTDHESLAAHYEQTANDMRAKSEDHKKRLKEYQVIPIYPEQYFEFEMHCLRLIKIFSQAAEENLEMAKLHRQMAARLSQ